MIKSILKILIWVLLVAFLAFTTWVTNWQINKVICQNISVQIIEDSPRFMQEKDIEELIGKVDTSVLGRRMKQINTENLEKKIQTIGCIKKAEVYRRISGISFPPTGQLIVKVEERSPIIRIKTSKSDYYLDEEGTKIPVTHKYSSKVTVFSGNVTDKIAKKELLPFAIYIYSNPFWKAQIEQIVVKKNKELLIIPRVGDQIIEFGQADHFEEKLRNLKAVYQHGFTKTGWKKYKIINLKYKNQVVCTKS